MNTSSYPIQTLVSFSRLAKKALYKVAFHGGFNNIWSSLMTIPEVDRKPPNLFVLENCTQARSITRCIKKHDRCVAEQIVAEAAEVRGKGRFFKHKLLLDLSLIIA